MACAGIEVRREHTAIVAVHRYHAFAHCVEEVLLMMRNIHDGVVGSVDDEGVAAARI